MATRRETEKKATDSTDKEAKKLYRQGLEQQGLGNIEEAITKFRKAAELGNFDAQFYLAFQLQRDKKYEEALKWTRCTAHHPASLLQLGWMYYNGQGIDGPDYEKAIECFERLVKRRQNNGSVRSAHRALAHAYYVGNGVDQSYSIAYYHYCVSEHLSWDWENPKSDFVTTLIKNLNQKERAKQERNAKIEAERIRVDMDSSLGVYDYNAGIIGTGNVPGRANILVPKNTRKVDPEGYIKSEEAKDWTDWSKYFQNDYDTLKSVYGRYGLKMDMLVWKRPVTIASQMGEPKEGWRWNFIICIPGVMVWDCSNGSNKGVITNNEWYLPFSNFEFILRLKKDIPLPSRRLQRDIFFEKLFILLKGYLRFDLSLFRKLWPGESQWRWFVFAFLTPLLVSILGGVASNCIYYKIFSQDDDRVLPIENTIEIQIEYTSDDFLNSGGTDHL